MSELTHRVERPSAEQAQALLPELVSLLRDVVNGGSSVGFIPPLAPETAREYWLGAFAEAARGKRVLLVSSQAGEVTGTVQLELVSKQNGLHRAEVQKLLVHTRFRKRGIARLLMRAVEDAAREAGRTLLVLDTERGSVAERMYEKCGYERAGIIPHYALSAGGSFIDTVLFYKLL
jgi:ribosomal protein S18 acetylase RimI-like enzyme